VGEFSSAIFYGGAVDFHEFAVSAMILICQKTTGRDIPESPSDITKTPSHLNQGL
jgi:hypothetical protein